MRVCVFLLLCVLQAVLPGAQSRPILRALVLCDTFAPKIGRASIADDYRMQISLQNIAIKLGLRLHLTTLRGYECSMEKVNQWKNSLPKNSEDIVLFY
jgi:hypothetical protein